MPLKMYRDCERCGGSDLAVVPDKLQPNSKEGRVVCKGCGYNATVTGWNYVNATPPKEATNTNTNNKDVL